MAAEVCEQAADLAHSKPFNVLLGAMTGVSVVGILAEVIVMRTTTMSMTVHANTRLLIIAHQIWLILHCIARVHAHVSDLIVFNTDYEDPCDYMSSKVRCFMLRTPVTLTFFLNACSIAGIVIERAVGTFFSAKYERMGKSVAFVLIAFELLAAITLMAMAVVEPQMFTGDTKAVYCSSLNSTNAHRGIIVMSVTFCVDLLSVLLLLVLLSRNTKSQRVEVHTNLSHRYQMSENIASIRTLLPLVIFHSTLYAVFIATILTFFLANRTFSQKVFAMFLESVQLTPVYAVFLPLVLVYMQRLVQKRKEESLRSAINVSKNEATTYYFESLFIIPPKSRTSSENTSGHRDSSLRRKARHS